MSRSNKPVIALFSASLVGGGAERVLVNLARGFISRGLSVDVVLSRATGEYLSDLPAEVRIVNLNSRRVLTSLPGLVSYLRRCRPVAVIGFQDHCNIAAAWARKLANDDCRVIATVHTTWSGALNANRTIRQTILKHVAKSSYSRGVSVVAVSEGVADDMAKAVGVARRLIRVIYNPIVDDRLTQLAQQDIDHPWFVPCGDPVIVGVGRLAEEKDFSTLLRAFSLVRAEARCRLVLLGEGPERTKLQQLARNLGIEHDTQFAGFVKNPYPYMKRATAFVLSSSREGLPTALVEALALGTPVISTDCRNGPREILCDGKFGKLAPVGDARALARAVLDVFRGTPRIDPAAVARFSFEAAVNSYLELASS